MEVTESNYKEEPTTSIETEDNCKDPVNATYSYPSHFKASTITAATKHYLQSVSELSASSNAKDTLATEKYISKETKSAAEASRIISERDKIGTILEYLFTKGVSPMR